MKRLSIIGKVFGRLTVLEDVRKDGRRWLHCQCSCGNKKWIAKGDVLSGHATSCTCLQRERISQRSKTHGRTGDPIYAVWISMRDRCHNPNNDSYPDYGGRGIVVCDRWRYSFENFLADMGERPSAKHLLDRENNDGNYEPGNVRWVVSKVSARNRRSTVFLTLGNDCRPAAEWSERLKIGLGTLLYRKRIGWSDEKVLTAPLTKGRPRSKE